MSPDLLVAFLRRHLHPVGAVLILLSIVLAALPLYSLFEAGPFNWQIHQAAFKEGGIEALMLAGAAVAICLYVKPILLRIVGLCVLGVLYLRVHHVDLPLLAAVLYFEALLVIGRMLVYRWRDQAGDEHGFMLYFLCGIGAYSALIAVLSAFRFAYPSVMYGGVLVLGLLAAVFTRHVPYAWRIMLEGVDASRIERLVFALLYVTVLVLAAKTNLINDYDSQWYGLRSTYVLEQGGTIFANLGLAHFVFYYPKLYEALILPLCLFPDSSYPAAFNIACYVFALCVVRRILVDFTADRTLAAVAALMVGWIPVVLFSTLSVKPDFFTAVALLVAASYLMRFLAERHWGLGLCGIGALAIALCAKLTAIPFGGLMAIFCLPAAFVCLWHLARGDRHAPGVRQQGQYAVAFLCGLMAFVVFTYRTYAITGLPYVGPDFLVELAQAMGFEAHFPYEALANAQLGDGWHFTLDRLGIIYYALLWPNRLPHIVFSWIGNIFVLTGLVAVVTAGSWRAIPGFVRPFLLICVPSFISMMVFIAFLGRIDGGDGNYYLLPIMLFTTVSTVVLHYARPQLRNAALTAFLISTVANGIVWFGATPQWRGGTAPFSAVLSNTTFDSVEENQRAIKTAGFEKIAAAMSATNGHCTALAGGDEIALFKLPCGVESARTLAGLGSGYFTNTETLSRYVSQARFDFIMVPNVPARGLLSKLFDSYAGLPGVTRIDDVLYSALDLRAVSASLPVLPVETADPDVPSGKLLLTGYIPGLKAAFPDEKRPPWRQPFTTADERLRKYLGEEALVAAVDTTVTFASDAVPFRCPGHMGFWLGLLPIDQLSQTSDPVLTVSWSDGGSGSLLGSVDIPLPRHGFQARSIALGKCGKQVTRVALHVHDAPGAKPVSVVIADPLLDK